MAQKLPCDYPIELVEYIKNNIGIPTYITETVIKWDIPNILVLSIHLYKKSSILLEFKGKLKLKYRNDIKLSELNLKKFIQNNKDIIKDKRESGAEGCQQRHTKQNVLVSENVKPCFVISRSLRQRYESQACKPYPIKYPWLSD